MEEVKAINHVKQMLYKKTAKKRKDK